MNINQLRERLAVLEPEIKELLDDSGYTDWGDDFVIEKNKKSPDDNFMFEESTKIIRFLDDAYSRMRYLQRPIKFEGILTVNDNGRYLLGSEKLDRDDRIEVLIYDEFVKEEKWVITHVAYDGKKYYLDGLGYDLNGQRARKRG